MVVARRRWGDLLWNDYIIEIIIIVVAVKQAEDQRAQDAEHHVPDADGEEEGFGQQHESDEDGQEADQAEDPAPRADGELGPRREGHVADHQEGQSGHQELQEDRELQELRVLPPRY